MTGTEILIAAIIIVFVIAFVITMIFVNAQTSKMIDVNAKLSEFQNSLLAQNKMQAERLKKLEEQVEHLQQEQAARQRTLADQQQELADLQHELDELHHRLENLSAPQDMMMTLHRQTRKRKQEINATQDMTDEELMEWVDDRINETQLFTSPTLSLKDLSNALGLTQKRLGQLFKNHERFNYLGDYLTEKRLRLACELMRDNPDWTIEAVAKEAGFQTRRTFQEVMKQHLGLTPSQLRQTLSES